MATRWLEPAQYPVEHFCVLTQEDDYFFGATRIRGYAARLESARTNKDPMEFWEVLNETGEEYLEWHQALAELPEGVTKGGRGRGKTPRLRKVALAAPCMEPDVGAEPARLRLLARAIRRLEEYIRAVNRWRRAQTITQADLERTASTWRHICQDAEKSIPEER